MPPDDDAPNETAPGSLPLGRNASRALVIGSILFVLIVVGSGTWLMLHLARSGPPPQQVAAPADTTDTSSAMRDAR